MPLSVRITKRLMDILISSLALIILSPLLVLIAIAIKLDSPGRVLYTQRRMKQYKSFEFGSPFNIEEVDTFLLFKFRTMYSNAEARTGAVNAIENDPRVTRVGSVLRSMRIDEIPNLINVLFGQLSIVGPRADRVEIYQEVEQEFPIVWERTRFVKPGITGLAQLALRSDGSLNGDNFLTSILPESDMGSPVLSFRYKMYYDFAYQLKLSKFWSFLITDIKILLKTPGVMFIHKNVI